MKPDFDDDFGRDGAFALSPDAMIWLVCAMVVSTLLLGIGLVTILTVPALIADAARHILAAVITSFMFAPLFAVSVSRRMRLRNWGRRAWVKGDLISG